MSFAQSGQRDIKNTLRRDAIPAKFSNSARRNAEAFRRRQYGVDAVFFHRHQIAGLIFAK